MAKINKELLDMYKKQIKSATTVEELNNISYDAFKRDTSVTIWDMASGTRCLSNEVTKLCTRRKLELEGYTKEQIAKMEQEAKEMWI